MFPNMSKNSISKTCFPLKPTGHQLLILSSLLKVTSLQNSIGFLSMEKRIYSIILISCVMKNPLLLELYLIKMIPPKLFTTVFSWLISFLKENGALPLVPPEVCHLLPFPIHIMIISLLGLDSCYTRMKTCLIPSLLILINISLLICLFGSTPGGLNLALLLKYF